MYSNKYLIIGLLFFSCQSVYSIKKGGEPTGIPFHTKKLIYVQKSTYVIPFLELTLSLKYILDDKEIDGGTFNATHVKQSSNELTTLTKKIKTFNTQKSTDISSILESFHNLPRIFEDKNHAFLVGNTVTRQMVIADTVLYLNGKEPWFGSKTINSTLNSDNTLSAAQGTAESDLTNLLTSIIPSSEIISSILKLDGSEETDSSDVKKSNFIVPENPLKIMIVLKKKGKSYQYDFTKEVNSSLSPQSIPFTYDGKSTNLEFTKKLVSQESLTKKKNDNSIDFNGTVTLPKKEN